MTKDMRFIHSEYGTMTLAPSQTMQRERTEFEATVAKWLIRAQMDGLIGTPGFETAIREISELAKKEFIKT